mmetsp:Transcript_3015/g.7723  ORF Transcript_3015/g.7723 Transcript_3015/m.7723 type:complete len:325 (-) Transcript_3015:40-1014(-)
MARKILHLRATRFRAECPWSCRGFSTLPAQDNLGQLHLIGMDSFGANIDIALHEMRRLRPKQVMLETCSQRLTLAEKQASQEEAAASASKSSSSTASSTRGGAAETPRAVSHMDAISLIHGGLQGQCLTDIARVATEVGAQVYAVDRPYQATQNRVARQLFFHPKEMLEFLRYFAEVLAGHASKPVVDSTPSPFDLELRCPNVYTVVVQEREKYISTEVARRRVQGHEVVVCCVPDRIPGLKELLQGHSEGATPRHELDVSSRVWPLLMVLVYVLLPGYGGVYLLWRLSRAVANCLSGGFGPFGVKDQLDVPQHGLRAPEARSS